VSPQLRNKLGVHVADHQSHLLTDTLVSYKNGWADAMYRWPNPTVQEQKATWAHCMEQAEKACRELRNVR
jgi:hypothetical protein